MVMALGETFINKVGYRSVVSQNEITWVFKILDIFRTASPFSRAPTTEDSTAGARCLRADPPRGVTQGQVLRPPRPTDQISVQI